jgi:hypothetical protein
MAEPELRMFRSTDKPEMAKPFNTLARKLLRELPSDVERGVALRKLLEAMDAAVRSGVAVVPKAEVEE